MASNNKKPPAKGKGVGNKRKNQPLTPEEKRERSKDALGIGTPEKKRRAREMFDVDIRSIERPVKNAQAPEEEAVEEPFYNDTYDDEPRGFRIPWLRWCFNLMITGALMGTCVVVAILLYYTKDLPSTAKLYEGPSSPPITLLARDGTPLGTLGGFHGEARSFAEFPPHLIQAVLATEDRRFFKHMGIDVQGLIRAMVKNLRAGRIVEGGSTVTQQLAKVVFLTPERNIKRKVQELILAVWLEYTFTKEEILGMYLNRVYMGAGNYGMDAAAQQYFGKSIGDINIHEAAMLAGMLKAPSRYSPFNNPKLSQERTQQILLNMVDAGYLKKEHLTALPKRLEDPKAALMHHKAKFFVDWVGSLIPEYIAVPNEGVTVVTTLDPTLQAYAEESVVAGLKEKEKIEGALVSATPKGEILAMVGGKSYNQSQFNRAAQAKRQPGSAFKLFVYLAAMEKGYGPANTIVDEPVAVKDFSGWWSPKNYYNEYLGKITLQDAFAKSINTVAVKLSEDVGRAQVIEIARRLGITSQLLNTPSLPLGTNEVTLLEMVQAFAHLPNDGRMVRLYAVQKILSADGKVIYTHPNYDLPRVLDDTVVRKMNQLTMAVTKYGTAQTAKFGRPVAGKTGTTQDYRDAWFIGYTPQIVTGVWIGKDDNTSMGKKVTGGVIPATIFREYMNKAHGSLPEEQLPDAAGIVDGVPAATPDSSGFMRWFGFGSRKNRKESMPSMTPEERMRKENPWMVPDGEELTPPWKQRLQTQPQTPEEPSEEAPMERQPPAVFYGDEPPLQDDSNLPPWQRQPQSQQQPVPAPQKIREGIFDRLF